MHRTILWPLVGMIALSLLSACGTEDEPVVDAIDYGANPFLEQTALDGKADTAYLNPDGIEIEVDMEADISTSAWQSKTGPAYLGQFAVTYLRSRKIMYLESLAEIASSRERVEWLVDGEWISAAYAEALNADKLTHFRIRGVNAVLLHDAADGVEVGTIIEAPVPRVPYSVMADAGEDCADSNGHITLSQSIYWYLWNPSKSECTLDTQQMTLTVTYAY